MIESPNSEIGTFFSRFPPPTNRMRLRFRQIEESIFIRRLLAFIFHLIGIFGAYYLAFQLRFDFAVEDWRWEIFWQTVPWAVSANMLCVFVFGLYQGLWRFFTLNDCIVTAAALSVGTIVTAGAVFVVRDYSFELYPRSVLFISFLLFLFWEIGGRGFVRLSRESLQIRNRDPSSNLKRLLLIGDPQEADVLLRSVQHSGELGRVVGIVSEHKKHAGSKLRGVRISTGLDSAAALVKDLSVSTLIFLPPCTRPRKIRKVIDKLSAEKLVCNYQVIPSMDELASGRLNVSSIRKVAIEDLLPRVPYRIEMDKISHSICGKKILVTGAGGSIGSEICVQLLKFKPDTLVLYEISEFQLFKTERELLGAAKEAGVRIIACTGDVKNANQLKAAIRDAGGIDIFYHAAAYKHVDLMERNAITCFQNNVIGSHVAATVAEEEGVDHFVLISTDKAVRPTSLMGASKRLAERLLIEREKCGTSFRAVRFGNVLGSNGSVVPIFRSQIEKGGPVTVTSRGVTRFFMTIPEAVELVLAAGAIEEDRRIFVLEMGEAVRIDEMARRMIELSGLIPDVDIPIVYTGLKSGEKEYEELLTDDENVVRTDLDRIWVVAKDAPGDLEPVNIGRLLELIDEEDEEGIRIYAHSLIRGSMLNSGIDCAV